MATKKTSNNSSNAPVSKSEYIRNQPTTLSASEVVASAKALGMGFDEAYVHKIRGRAKASVAAAAKPAPKSTVAAKKDAAPKSAAPATKSPTAAKKSAATKAPSTAKKEAAPKGPSSKGMSKADFVRSHAKLSAKEVVQKAKAAGIKLAESYVYNVRGMDKANTKSKPVATNKPAPATKPAARSRAAAPSPTNSSSSSAVETLLKAVAAEIGLGRAIGILDNERARVKAVIGG